MYVYLQWCTYNGQTVFLSGVDKLDVVLYVFHHQEISNPSIVYDNDLKDIPGKAGVYTMTRKCVYVLCVVCKGLLSCRGV